MLRQIASQCCAEMPEPSTPISTESSPFDPSPPEYECSLGLWRALEPRSRPRSSSTLLRRALVNRSPPSRPSQPHSPADAYLKREHAGDWVSSTLLSSRYSRCSRRTESNLINGLVVCGNFESPSGRCRHSPHGAEDSRPLTPAADPQTLKCPVQTTPGRQPSPASGAGRSFAAYSGDHPPARRKARMTRLRLTSGHLTNHRHNQQRAAYSSR